MDFFYRLNAPVSKVIVQGYSPESDVDIDLVTDKETYSPSESCQVKVYNSRPVEYNLTSNNDSITTEFQYSDYDTIEEEIVATSGQANTSRPIYEIEEIVFEGRSSSYSYFQGEDAISFTEKNILARIRYTTRADFWKVTNANGYEGKVLLTADFEHIFDSVEVEVSTEKSGSTETIYSQMLTSEDAALAAAKNYLDENYYNWKKIKAETARLIPVNSIVELCTGNRCVRGYIQDISCEEVFSGDKYDLKYELEIWIPLNVVSDIK